MLRFISFATSAVGVFAFECTRNTIRSTSLNCARLRSSLLPIVHRPTERIAKSSGPGSHRRLQGWSRCTLAKAAREGLGRGSTKHVVGDVSSHALQPIQQFAVVVIIVPKVKDGQNN